jgi:hypothetical protein
MSLLLLLPLPGPELQVLVLHRNGILSISPPFTLLELLHWLLVQFTLGGWGSAAALFLLIVFAPIQEVGRALTLISLLSFFGFLFLL